MADSISDALTAIEGTRQQHDPQHEGLRDFARLNLRPETLTVIRQALERYDRRSVLLNAATLALTNLRADGYPAIARVEASDAVLADLRANVQTISAAFGTFDAATAARMLLEPGAVEQK